MESKIDKILEEITDMKVTLGKQEVTLAHQDETLAKNTESLAEHMRRTLANEALIETIRTDIEPIKKHVVFIKGVLWAIGFVGGGLYSLYKAGIIHKLL